MKILLTGSTGFLGSRILQECPKNHEIISLGRGVANSIPWNLKSGVPALGKYQAVIHCAGFAHKIPANSSEEKEVFDVNVNGTQNLLNAFDNTGYLPESFIYISSVSVYGVEHGILLDENTPVKPISAYAKSKLEAEHLVQDWCNLHKINCLILRLPLLVGPSAPGNLGQMQRAIQRGYYFRLGDGAARRSMVAAKDVATFIFEVIGKSGIYHLTDGTHFSYAEIENAIAKKYNRKIRKIPLILALCAAKLGDVISAFPMNTYRLNKLKNTLTFSDEKARKILGWNVLGIPESEF